MSQPQFQIRSATPGDAAALGELHVESWRSAYAGILPTEFLVNMSASAQAMQWTRRLKQGERFGGPLEQVFVAEDLSGRLVGFGSSGPNRDHFLTYPAEVYTLYVAPDLLNVGIGRALLTSLYDNLLALGCQSAVIWALLANPCRHFYSATGGQIVAERETRFYNRDLREVAYGWPDLAGWRKALSHNRNVIH